MKKVLFVLGTRPEAVKLAPVIKEAEALGKFKVVVCVFRQHQKMLEEQIQAFDLRPSFDIPMPLGDRGLLGKNPFRRLWSLFLVGVGGLRFLWILKREKPDMVVVQGDTSTVFLTAFIAYHFKIKIAHVEAGLRTYNKYSPFPEEANRRLISGIADLNFAPTEQAKENLLSEHVEPGSISVVGNTVLDALRIIIEKQNQEGEDRWLEFLREKHGIDPVGRKLVLVTAHRRESFGGGLQRIAAALRDIARARPDALIVYPVHLNPSVRGTMLSELCGLSNLIMCEPLAYEPFVCLMRHAHVILTDSGGIQEEVSLIGVPTLVMREVTERPEGILAGNAKLVGTASEIITRETIRLLDDPEYHETMSKTHSAFGDGHAAERVIGKIAEYLDS